MMDYAKEYDRVVEQSNAQQERIASLEAELAAVKRAKANNARHLDHYYAEVRRLREELAAVSEAIGSCEYIDPPDGGSVSLAEQVRRMRIELAAAQAREQENDCRISLIHQIHELADHIERAEHCVADPDMLKQMIGQRAFAMNVANKWNQNGNPFALPSDRTCLDAALTEAKREGMLEAEGICKDMPTYIDEDKGYFRPDASECEAAIRQAAERSGE